MNGGAGEDAVPNRLEDRAKRFFLVYIIPVIS